MQLSSKHSDKSQEPVFLSWTINRPRERTAMTGIMDALNRRGIGYFDYTRHLKDANTLEEITKFLHASVQTSKLSIEVVSSDIIVAGDSRSQKAEGLTPHECVQIERRFLKERGIPRLFLIVDDQYMVTWSEYEEFIVRIYCGHGYLGKRDEHCTLDDLEAAKDDSYFRSVDYIAKCDKIACEIYKYLNGEYDIIHLFKCLRLLQYEATAWKAEFGDLPHGYTNNHNDEWYRGAVKYQHAWKITPINVPAGSSYMGDWFEASQLLQEAVSIFENADDYYSLGLSLHQLGYCNRPDLNPSGSWETAINFYEKAVLALATAQAMPQQVRSLWELAECWCPKNNLQGSWQQTIQYYEETLALFDTLEDKHKPLMAMIMYSYGAYLQPDINPLGSWKKAAYQSEMATTCCTGKNQIDLRARCIHQQAWCLHHGKQMKGDTVLAASLYEEASKLSAMAGNASVAQYSKKMAEVCTKADNDKLLIRLLNWMLGRRNNK